VNASGEHRLHFQALEAFQFFSADHLTEIVEASRATQSQFTHRSSPIDGQKAPRLEVSAGQTARHGSILANPSRAIHAIQWTLDLTDPSAAR
jgi:hypothetical protein